MLGLSNEVSFFSVLPVVLEDAKVAILATEVDSSLTELAASMVFDCLSWGSGPNVASTVKSTISCSFSVLSCEARIV